MAGSEDMTIVRAADVASPPQVVWRRPAEAGREAVAAGHVLRAEAPALRDLTWAAAGTPAGASP